MFVLPHHEFILLQVPDVGRTWCPVAFQHHPSDVGVEEPIISVIRVQVGVRVPMMSTVFASPPIYRCLHGGTPTGQEK